MLFVCLPATAYLAWIHQTRWPLRGPDAQAQTLVIAPGSSVRAVAAQLQASGLAPRPWVFQWLVRLRGTPPRAGTYSLEGPLTLEQIADILARGAVVRREATFPEGRNIADMAAIAAGHGLPRAAFLAAGRETESIADLDPHATDLEGYLFPDTYDLPTGDDAAQVLVRRMVQRFREVTSPELGRLAARSLTVREWVTLASIVELETARGDERPRIAAVFLNRLQKGMLLQTDPTVIYALRKQGGYDGNIRKKDLQIDSPYNTYRFPGLPPGPIGSPGREALRAVLDPAPGRELYFVSRNDGSHEFNETLSAHERAVDRYQRQGFGRSRRGQGAS